MSARLVLYGPEADHGAIVTGRHRRFVYVVRWHEGRRMRERSTGFGFDPGADRGTRDAARAAAEKALGAHLIAHACAGRPRGPLTAEEMSVADALAYYLEDHCRTLADPARPAFAAARLLEHFSDRPVSVITGAVCRSYVRSRTATGVGAGTVRRELGTLRAALRHCEREGYLVQPPAVVLPDAPRPRERWYTRSEVAALIRAARKGRARDHLPLFILIAVYTGKRSAAIKGLQWQPNTEGDGWVDLHAGRITWGTGAGNKRRGEPTPIPRPLLTHLRQARRRTRKYVLEYQHRPVRSMKTAWWTALKDAGLPHGTIHDFRHTAASVALSTGAPTWKVAQYLGMTEQTLTRVYGHCIPGALDDVAEAVARKR